MRIGFIGLGAMGRGMAASLQWAGHELIVNDVCPEAATEFLGNGALWAPTPQIVAESAQLIFTSLPTPADVETVGLGEGGLAGGFRRGAAWFDLSTNSVDVVRRLEATFAEQGVSFLDAPVSGGPIGAGTGKLAIWVGGDRKVFDLYAEVLESIGDRIQYIGSIGAGTIAKLAHNMASLAINCVIAEVLTMGVKAGLEPIVLWEAIRSGAAGRSRMFDNVGRRFLRGRLDPPSFQLRLAYKDAQLALQVGREASVPMKLCSLAALDMTEAMNRGWGARDTQSVLLLQTERANLPPFALTEEEVERVLGSGDTTKYGQT